MNRNEYDERERRWSQNPGQQEGGSPWDQQSGYGRQGNDRTYSMRTGYDDTMRRRGASGQGGYDERNLGGGGAMQDVYGPEGAWAGSSGYAGQGRGWEEQRGYGQQGGGYGQQRGYGSEGRRGDDDVDERARYQGGYSQRGMNRGGASTEFGTPSGYGMEGWGQQAYRGSDYGPAGRGGGVQDWRVGNQRAQGYPGTDYYSGQEQGWGGQENPWGERSMRGSTGDASMWGGTSGWSGQQGPYAGRGPRGYQRSDERIREDVCELLCNHGDVDASEIDIEVHNGEVTLKGTVPDRWQKRMTEDVVELCSGVKDVHNQLRVTPATAGGQGGQTAAGLTGQGTGTTGTNAGQTSGTAGTTAATGRPDQTTTTRSR